MKTKSQKTTILTVILLLCLVISCCGCVERIHWEPLHDKSEVKSVAVAILTYIDYDWDAGMDILSYETLAYVNDIDEFFFEILQLRGGQLIPQLGPSIGEQVFVIEYLNGDYEVLAYGCQFQFWDNGCKSYNNVFAPDGNYDGFDLLFEKYLNK